MSNVVILVVGIFGAVLAVSGASFESQKALLAGLVVMAIAFAVLSGGYK